jgi:DNA-binding IclR family transcriptional regulator
VAAVISVAAASARVPEERLVELKDKARAAAAEV